MEIDPPSMVIGSSSLDLSQSSSSTVEVSNVSNGMVTEATPTMTTSAGTAATGTPAIAMMPMAAMATPLMQSSLSSSTVPTAASVPALSFTQFRDRSAAAAAATSNNKRVKAGGESAMKDDDGMMNGNGATDNADMATANSNSRNGNNNSTTNAKPDKALRQQKRLERMQQARQHINQLTPKQRRQLTKRLKHTAKALLSPLEKSMLRVLFRRQCGLEPALSSSPKKIKQEKRAAKATVDPEDVMAWSPQFNDDDDDANPDAHQKADVQIKFTPGGHQKEEEAKQSPAETSEGKGTD
eukprot:CAMPEP_0119554612 /NCGR_PEP_ID=MMETSP1352-20130426/7053_1 /TAXON_ID=265584 /ORGANISM="Stauroneis constricta, Strain CCMP1120" /LENGTH=296 /DNA_ID=CAMNT_0007601227 /DNA_START=192 /DNA_END=1081 /DNA_ORIENTATION=+